MHVVGTYLVLVLSQLGCFFLCFKLSIKSETQTIAGLKAWTQPFYYIPLPSPTPLRYPKIQFQDGRCIAKKIYYLVGHVFAL